MKEKYENGRNAQNSIVKQVIPMSLVGRSITESVELSITFTTGIESVGLFTSDS